MAAPRIDYDLLIKSAALPGGMTLARRTLRRLQADEALVRIHRAAICGTDLHIVQWNAWAASRYVPPFALGHEFSGIIVDKGTAVADLMVGDKVAGETHLECGDCSQCRMGRGHTCLNLRVFSRLDQGAFAEFAIVPARLLRVLPPMLPHKYACLMEPLGIAVRAVIESRAGTGRLLVVGCGPIGLLTIAAAKALGATMIVATDFSADRRRIAMSVGADVAIDPAHADATTTMDDVKGDGGFDAAIESSGSASGITTALAVTRPGGVLVLVGLPNEPVAMDLAAHVILREVVLRGIYGRLLRETWQQVEELLPRLGEALDRIVTHEFELCEFEHAFEVAASGAAGKVQFRMTRSAPKHC